MISPNYGHSLNLTYSTPWMTTFSSLEKSLKEFCSLIRSIYSPTGQNLQCWIRIKFWVNSWKLSFYLISPIYHSLKVLKLSAKLIQYSLKSTQSSFVSFSSSHFPLSTEKLSSHNFQSFSVKFHDILVSLMVILSKNLLTPKSLGTIHKTRLKRLNAPLIQGSLLISFSILQGCLSSD